MTIITRKIGLCIIALVMLIYTTGCANEETNESNATIENSAQTTAVDYSFWQKENEVRFFVPMSDDTILVDADEGLEGIGPKELPKEYTTVVKGLRQMMVDYFNRHYQLDVSAKLGKQIIRVFDANGPSDGVMGYVDPKNPDILNLNSVLFTEYKDLFANSYIHESLHQLGFMSTKTNMIDEGITDAFTDLILIESGINSIPTPIYGAARQLAYQIVAADKGIAEFYLSNRKKNIEDRITEKIKSVKMPFETKKAGKFLSDLESGLTYGIKGNVDEYYVALQAQEIVRSYCQECEPDNETIDYIRSCYLITDYEQLQISFDGEKYLIQ